MSDEIDNKIVSMSFNNRQFEQNIQQTLASLQKLNDSLTKAGAAKGLGDLQRQADKFNFNGMSTGIDTISKKFIALSTVAITALANITNRAVDAGLRIAKSFTLEPLTQGFSEYELKMGSIQTILANTAKDGTTLDDVTKSLDDLNNYADKTIYNFGQMTKNIGLFTNAGIKLEDATAMIKGFSNEAAASGTNAEGAAAAAYQLSQALSAGQIRLMDWRSLQNVGMGNANMKSGLIDLAQAMGKFNSETGDAKSIAKDFNGSLEKGWLTADVMTNYLKIQAGELSKEQMMNLGLSEKQITAFQKQQKTAEEAATKVRTFTQLFGTMKEAIGSGWSETFAILIGDFDQATNLFTKVNNALGPIIQGFADARNNLLKGWAKLGGREKLIEALGNAFNALMQVMGAVKYAWKQVFPPATAKSLFELTEKFANFTKKLMVGSKTINLIKEIFRALFSILGVGVRVVKGVFSVIVNTFKIMKDSAGDTGSLVERITELLAKFNDWIATGAKIEEFFARLRKSQEGVLGPLFVGLIEIAKAFKELITGDKEAFFARLQTAFYALSPLTENFRDALASAAQGLENLVGKVKDFFANLAGPNFTPIVNFLGALGDTIGELKDKLSFKPSVDTGDLTVGTAALNAMKSAGTGAKSLWDGIGQALETAGRLLKPLIEGIGKVMKGIGQKLVDWAKDLDFTDVMLIINAGLIFGIYRLIKKFKGLLEGIVDDLRDLIGKVSAVFDNLTKSLTMMQRDVQANIILKIAAAVGILALSLILLSKLKPDELGRGLASIAAIMGLLSGVMVGFLKMAEKTGAGIGKMLGIGAAMNMLATSVLIMSGAVAILAQLDPARMAAGIAGLGAIIGGLLVFVNTVKVPPPAIIATAGALVLLGVALTVFSGAILALGSMDPNTLKQGLLTVAAILVGLSAVSAILTGGFTLMGTAAGILILSGALLVFAGVLQLYGSMDTKTLAVGLAAVAGSLLILALATNMMVGAASGAAALVLAAGAIIMLTAAMKVLGEMTDREILRGLGTMLAFTGIIAILGVTAIAVGAPLLLLAGALALLGGAILLAGVGFLALGAGLKLVSEGGKAAVEVLKFAILELVTLLPTIATQVAIAIGEFASTIADQGSKITDAFSTLMGSMLDAVNENFPKMKTLFFNLIDLIIEVVRNKFPEIVKAGWDLLISLLKGVEDRIPEIGKTVTGIIVGIIKAIDNNIQQIITAGTDLVKNFLWGMAKATLDIINTAAVVLITFLRGIETAIREHDQEIRDAALGIADALIDGLVEGLGLTSAVNKVKDAVTGLADKLPSWLKGPLGINSPSKVTAEIGKNVVEGLTVGVKNAKSRAEMKEAFKAISGEIAGALNKAKDAVQQAKEERDRILEQDSYTYKELAEANKKLNQAYADRDKLMTLRNNYNKYLDDEREKLLALSKSYETLTGKLEKAKQKLSDLKSEKASKRSELFNQYYKLPEIDKTTGLQGYMRDAKNTIQETGKYRQSLDRLRKLGLDNRAYEKLLEEGPEAQSLVNQLEQGGKQAVSEFNKVNNQLASQANSLAKDASGKLYDAGIKAAEGLVKGLQNQQKAIQAQMNKIADSMVGQIKKSLGIKSPSREFMKVAVFSMEGLIKGFNKNKANAGKAAAGVGDETIYRMRKSLDKIKNFTADGIDSKPIIRPVVDLTEYKRGVAEMKKKNSTQLNVTPTLSGAQAAAYAARIKQVAPGSTTNPESTKQIIFQQTNNSPEPLTTVEIYRQSKTLISQLES